jgi:GrpB-like predicted nucleotidyltransferase (UPF0157 family)
MDDIPGPIPVELVPHRPEWAGMAHAEAARLKTALDDVLRTVHHIGSTAIPGIRAKPIVDLIPIVTNLAELDAAKEAVRALGYRWHGEFGLAGRRYCTLSDPATAKRKVQLHCYAEGDASIARHLAFRDFLRAHPDKAKEYETEKLRAASLQPHDTNLYNDEKNDWIKRVECEAFAWWRSTRPPAP